MNCKDFRNELPDLLLGSPGPPSAKAALHLEGCSECRDEYASFRSTFGLLDEWVAPDPSPYFDQKLAVRLRELQAEPAMGWLERLQTRLLFNTGRQFRPAMAGALAAILLMGGGTAAELNYLSHPKPAEISATVNDLQILDRNEQAFQQMDQLLQEDDSKTTDDSGQSAQPLS